MRTPAVIVMTLFAGAALAGCQSDRASADRPPVADERIVASALSPAPGSPVVLATYETNATWVFDAGSSRISEAGGKVFARLLDGVDHAHPLRIDVFNDERDRLVRANPPISAALSEKRAAALKAYLESSAGGGWLVDRAAGQGFRIVDGHPADRRIVVAVMDR